VARLGRSQPVNWLLRSRHRTNLAIPAAAALPASMAVTAGANISGSATFAEITNVTSAATPPAAAALPATVSLTAGGSIVRNALLPAAATVTAVPSSWVFTGPVPLSYLQYLEAGGILAVEPGEAVVAMETASGWSYPLAVPPADGRWVTLGSGGQVLAAAAPPAGGRDDLSWDPPPPLAHLPVPFALIAARITRKQR